MERNVKIVGHELVPVREKMDDGSYVEYDELKVKLKGVGSHGKNKVDLYVEPEDARSYPLGEIAVLTFEIRQQRLPLTEVTDQVLEKAADDFNRLESSKGGTTRATVTKGRAH